MIISLLLFLTANLGQTLIIFQGNVIALLDMAEKWSHLIYDETETNWEGGRGRGNVKSRYCYHHSKQGIFKTNITELLSNQKKLSVKSRKQYLIVICFFPLVASGQILPVDPDEHWKVSWECMEDNILWKYMDLYGISAYIFWQIWLLLQTKPYMGR